MQKDENEKEVGGTPVAERKKLAEKKLDLLSKCTEATIANAKTKAPLSNELQKCLPFLFTSGKRCHSGINATEEQLKNICLTHILKKRCQQICQQMERSTASNEILTVSLILVYRNKGNQQGSCTTCYLKKIYDIL